MLVKLFDACGVLYDAGRNMISAREFLSDRIESVLFIAIDDKKRRGVKIVQPYS